MLDKKLCSKCNIIKTITDFHFRNDSNKYRNECKKCMYSINKEYIKTDGLEKFIKSRERARERLYLYNQKYRKENKDRRRTKSIQYNEKYKRSNPFKISANRAIAEQIRLKNIINPNKCSQKDCTNNKFISAHHDSYLKKHKLKIRWLCSRCHTLFHAEFRIYNVVINVVDLIQETTIDDKIISLVNENFQELIKFKTFENINFIKQNILNLLGINNILNIVNGEFGEFNTDLYGFSYIVKRKLLRDQLGNKL